MFLLTLIIIIFSSTAIAEPIVPPKQWTKDTRLWMARAYVAEAGWGGSRDHVAISYVLARRWNKQAKKNPKMTLLSMIRRYCSGLGPRIHTKRQRWVRQLRYNMTRPLAMPRNVSWKALSWRWKDALARAQQWYNGSLPDPCKGRAWHWGGSMDKPHPKMFRVWCGNTINIFYGVRNAN